MKEKMARSSICRVSSRGCSDGVAVHLILRFTPTAIIRAATEGNTGGAGIGATSRTARALNGIGLEGLRRLLNTGRLQFRAVGGDDDEDNDDDDAIQYSSSRRGAYKMSEFWDPVKEPIKAGEELLLGGEFGRTASRPSSTPKSAFASSRNMADTISSRRRALRRVAKRELSVSSH